MAIPVPDLVYRTARLKADRHVRSQDMKGKKRVDFWYKNVQYKGWAN